MSSGTVTRNHNDVLDANCSTGVEDKQLTCGSNRGWPTRLVQQLVRNRLGTLQHGQLYLDDQCGRCVVGTNERDDLAANVIVNSPEFYWSLAKGGSLGAADAYLNGDWDCDDLVSLFRVFCRNLNQSRSNAIFKRLSMPFLRLGHWMSRNTREGSRRNIEAHYDLGNEFFELFLDPSMMYSAAIFDSSETTLENAQTNRLESVCRVLELQASDHLVEIGTGWGGMAVYAATHYGCKVTTTTISQNQYDYAVRRVAEAGLQDQITVLKQDYRDLEGKFDKLVSLEMIEAVGPQFYDTYFAKCADLLKPDGRMLLQAIVIPEQRYAQYLKSVDFIQKYIFPGGSLPSVAAMQDSVTRTSQLRMLAMDDFADGYARTLREWRKRFHTQLAAVRELGYSERFIRMWDYYLAYCEAAFEERSVGVVHAVWGR